MTKTAAKPRAKKAAVTPAPTPAPAADKGKTLRIEDDGKKPMERVRADMATEGVLANVLTVQAFSQKSLGELDLTECAVSMRDTTKAVQGGDLKPVEAMLMAQAASLNAMFCELTRRAGLNMGEYLEATETYMRMALKAQAQCRSTLEALAEIKAPRSVLIAKQANIANGHQQVNNGASPGPARVEETATSPNGLLEAPQHGNFMDAGAAGTAGGAHPILAPVGALDRAAHG